MKKNKMIWILSIVIFIGFIIFGLGIYHMVALLK
jgi:hypothetical protein